MSEREYNFWQATLERSVSARTSLLTFSFATVLAILGIAISSDAEKVNPFLYLVPYMLIILFEGRIAYYRLIHARISAYLELVIPEDRHLDILGENVPEGQTGFFNVIAILNNYEMVFLSVATAVVFYIKYLFPAQDGLSAADGLILMLPVIASALVGIIVAYTYNYGKWKRQYRREWEKFIKIKRL